MYCPACSEYVPEGLGLAACPVCEEDLKIAAEMKRAQDQKRELEVRAREQERVRQLARQNKIDRIKNLILFTSKFLAIAVLFLGGVHLWTVYGNKFHLNQATGWLNQFIQSTGLLKTDSKELAVEHETGGNVAPSKGSEKVKPFILPTIDELLQAPESEIDLAKSYLSITETVSLEVSGQHIDIAQYDAILNRWANELKSQIGTESSPARIVEKINEFLFAQKGFSSDKDDPSYNKYENLVLNQVVNRKLGNCISLSLVYLALAEKLGQPFYPVVTPSHVFIRYDNGSIRINVEMTKQGESFPDSDYRKLYKIAENSTLYLGNLGKKGILSRMISAFGQAFSDRGLYSLAAGFFKKSQLLDPNNTAAILNLGAVYRFQKQLDLAIAEYEQVLRVDPQEFRALGNLGEVYIEKENPRKAFEYLEKAIQVNPSYDKAYYNMGVAYYLLKHDNLKAAEYFEKALQINPNLTVARTNLSIIKNKLQSQNPAARSPSNERIGYELRDGQFIHHDLKFQFDIPEGWHVRKGPPTEELSLDKSPSKIVLGCGPVDAGKTLDQMVKTMAAIDDRSSRKVQRLSEIHKEINGINISEITSLIGVRLNGENGELKAKSIYFMRNINTQNTFCILQFLTTSDRYPEDITIFDGIEESLAFDSQE